jgi:polar amino acid transport system substrate-binding protein
MFADKQVDGTTIIQESSGLPVAYSGNFMQYHNRAFALKSQHLSISSPRDLTDKRVIAFQNARKYLGEDFGRIAAANPRYKEMARQKGQTLMLLLGRADVVVMDESIFRFYLNELVAEGRAADHDYVAFDVFPPTPFKAAFNDPKVRDAFDRGIAAMRKDGRYDALYRTYARLYFPVLK